MSLLAPGKPLQFATSAIARGGTPGVVLPKPDSDPFPRMKRKPKLALRVNQDNPNHHLWNNRGVWWCHLTVHKPDATAERLRFSLKTRDVEQARERRDRIFRQIAEHYEIAA
jgi:hypothetical protein